MTTNTEALPEPFSDWPEYHESAMGCGLEDYGLQTQPYEAMKYGWDDYETRVQDLGPFFTADQMHAHAAKLCAARDAEIERLKREDSALNNLLYWVERAVYKGNANNDIEEAWDEYEAALKESKS